MSNLVWELRLHPLCSVTNFGTHGTLTFPESAGRDVAMGLLHLVGEQAVAIVKAEAEAAHEAVRFASRAAMRRQNEAIGDSQDENQIAADGEFLAAAIRTSAQIGELASNAVAKLESYSRSTSGDAPAEASDEASDENAVVDALEERYRLALSDAETADLRRFTQSQLFLIALLLGRAVRNDRAARFAASLDCPDP